MEHMFERLREKMHRHQASVRMVMIVGDQVLTGMPTSIEGFASRANASIDALAESLPEDDPLRAGTVDLRFDPPKEERFMERHIALRDAVLKRPPHEIELGTIRVDLNAVTAWGVLAPQDGEE